MTKSNLPEGRYLGCMEISSTEAVANYEQIGGGERTRFLRYMMGDDAKAYTVPGIECIGIAAGDGDSLAEVEASVTKEGDQASAYFGNMHSTFAQDIKTKYVDPLAAEGIEFGHNPVLESRPRPARLMAESRAARYLRGRT
jgi:hypothetical protein